MLGRLSEEQIKKGQTVLDQIKNVIETPLAASKQINKLRELSSEFYSFIPTTSGRVAPPPLNNQTIVGEKEALLEFWLRMGFEARRI